MFVYSLLRNRTADLKQFQRFSRGDVLSLVLSLALLQVQRAQEPRKLEAKTQGLCLQLYGRYCDLPDRNLSIHNNIQVNLETKSNLAKH
jgi:hypothetical protein